MVAHHVLEVLMKSKACHVETKMKRKDKPVVRSKLRTTVHGTRSLATRHPIHFVQNIAWHS
jgi:hypothetical protein